MAKNQINFDLFILCQTQKNEQPVDNPASDEKVVEFVKEWAKLSDLRYLELWPKLKAVSVDELKKRNATWHRSCYQDTVIIIIIIIIMIYWQHIHKVALHLPP